jgi:Spy/CpxP family protein refolding chaperone
MRRLTMMTMAACVAGATALSAQQPGTGPGPGAAAGPIGNPAEFLLAQTGELGLTDAQVTRLAAIARRGAERRRAMRERMDSLRPEGGPGTMRDSAGRARMRERAEQMRPAMERLREQSQAERRDAIAVLTPDQQARAWERVAMMSNRSARRGGGPRAGGAGMRRGPMRGEAGGPRGLGGRPAGERRQMAPGPRPRPDRDR